MRPSFMFKRTIRLPLPTHTLIANVALGVSDAERDRKVMVETNLLELDHLLKSCIQLTSADVDRAAELMYSYKGV